MICNDIATILDNHRSARHAPAQRAAVDAHLAACVDCAAAWHGHTELLALRVPPVPAALLERALLASRTPRSAEPRRARISVIVGSSLLAGAALASVTIVSLTRAPASPSPASEPITAAAQPAQSTEPRELPVQPEPARVESPDEPPTSVELVELALSVQPILRAAPVYPPDALKEGLDGHVRVKFDVSATGAVENISVLESSDARFEEPAVRAVSEWRFLPRIAAGTRVGSSDIRTIIRFVLNKEEPLTAPTPAEDEAVEAQVRDWTAFNEHLAVAMDRLAADNLRGVELQLDEMQAIYGADRADLWTFYGYLYTVQGNYGRAIDAYERSVALYTRANQARSAPSVALANLYFARHQYDLAVKALLQPNLPGGNNLMNPDGAALAEKLEALGIRVQRPLDELLERVR
jgi:protein TonB